MPSLRESLTYEPNELSFGTSGLRALVRDMTDLECYINVAGFLRFMISSEKLVAGETVYVAGDLRDSTPRILGATVQAIRDGGFEVAYLGLIPTPALANYAFRHSLPGIMVTGSHIPADRNGIKFYKRHDEVLKDDEAPIKQAVAMVRAELYATPTEDAGFDGTGSVKVAAELPAPDTAAAQIYLERYTSVFSNQPLASKTLVFYQHSAVGRDLLVELFRKLGAAVVPVGRSDVFVPIDTENVTAANRENFKKLAAEHPDAFAIISTDGDSDRPFVIDETGEFHRGDVLGAVVADWLAADFAAVPVSASDAVDDYLKEHGTKLVHTRIGSPYVIAAMKTSGAKRPVGWEVNGGFLTGVDLEIDGATLPKLPTRDAALPILVALLAAIKRGENVSNLFAELPKRYTQAGLIEDFPRTMATAILNRLEATEGQSELSRYFNAEDGFGVVTRVDNTDGIRIFFETGEIAHLRPSGNAPELRVYSEARTQERADQIVALALAEPDGILRRMQHDLGS